MTMKSSHSTIGIILTTVLIAFTGQAEVKYNHFSIEQAKLQAKVEGKKIFVVFSNLECSPCRWMEANVYSDSALAYQLNNNFIAVKSNGYTVTGKYEVMHYKVSMLPTAIFFDENGAEIFRVEGKRDYSKMSEITGLVLSGNYQELINADQRKEPIPIPRNNDVNLPMNPSLKSKEENQLATKNENL